MGNSSVVARLCQIKFLKHFLQILNSRIRRHSIIKRIDFLNGIGIERTLDTVVINLSKEIIRLKKGRFIVVEIIKIHKRLIDFPRNGLNIYTHIVIVVLKNAPLQTVFSFGDFQSILSIVERNIHGRMKNPFDRI